ncbi:C40 family peptidase [Pontibacter arcticus]|uniref:NlpC/P60 domain-containing protein n=1 Tax=Pontibacter arcticus TaxID=2080288 RepID=A0A364RIE3_9BACT|nr:C40 family peptidase [Pontibacter arcticus]RAU84045.1 hypothetical protein DP923_03030 [Pontibacter arcticus]
MTKNIILSALALFSLILSYFYDATPAQSATPSETVAATFISPYAINSPEDMVLALSLPAPTLPDEETKPKKEAAEERFYSKRLGLWFETSQNKSLVKTAAKWIGTPYRYGSSSKRGTDCSGFVTSIYREVYGIDLSRSSRSMFDDVERIKKDSMRTGDLVFFKRSPKQPIFHVGIYLKENKFIHSATNGGVMVSSLREPYYRKNFYAAGRVN